MACATFALKTYDFAAGALECSSRTTFLHSKLASFQPELRECRELLVYLEVPNFELELWESTLCRLLLCLRSEINRRSSGNALRVLLLRLGARAGAAGARSPC